ncbi:MAG: hypothetical protein GY707_04920 [Desulfobacteraceae bacterium]|nr:hypothetical protein [Desulfobacteraceae bacterium]
MRLTIVETIQFFKTNLFTISLFTLKIEIPFILIDNLNKIGNAPSILGLWIALVGLVFVFVVAPFSTGVQVSLYRQIINGSELNYKDCFRTSQSYLYPMIFASLIFLIIFTGGLVLFIVPGIIIGARLSYFPFFIIYEGYKPIPALQKSFNVTKNYVWEIATPMLFFTIILILPIILLYLLPENKGSLNFILWIIVDCAYAIFAWLSLIVAFRFYCIYRQGTSSN